MRRLSALPFVTASLGALTALVYLAYSLFYGFLGFPLDDAWIHQTYARNLILYHQFAYNPGEISVGSTSPLWTLLLTPAYALPVDFRLWTYLVGAVFLALTGWTLHRLGSHLFHETSLLAVVTAGLCILEWHLAWAALSGMETILFVFLSLLCLERHLAGERPIVTGLIAGLLALTRPEGALLALLLLIDTAWRRRRGPQSLSQRGVALHVTFLLAGFGIVMLPYFVFNLSVSGEPFPNTFYAKYAEYQQTRESVPLPLRWIQLAGVSFIGAQAVLIPGCLYGLYRIVRHRRADAVLPLAWWFVFITAYAIRLPVTYQHGRYLIPTIPIILLYGVWGTGGLQRLSRIAKGVLVISACVLAVVFWLRGAEQYATDVRIIDSELASTGRWLRENTAAGDLIGVHDIGAIGYFSDRVIVDMAGLADPKVIPFIRDEERLLTFLEEEGVDYVAIFPSWYPRMARSSKLLPVHRSASPWIRLAGGDNIVVYKTLWDGTEGRY
jgi:hypothetical protein